MMYATDVYLHIVSPPARNRTYAACVLYACWNVSLVPVPHVLSPGMKSSSFATIYWTYHNHRIAVKELYAVAGI